MTATRICFIRHGETDWNAEKRIQGQLDVPLNATGVRQAMAMADNAAHYRFAALYSSDLARARDTAGMLARRDGLEVLSLPLLRERHFGILQGLTGAEARARHPEAHAHHAGRDLYDDFRTGESLLAFAARVESAVQEMTRRHPGQTIAAVTHAGVLDTLYRKATGRPLHTPRDFPSPNCALNWFRIDPHGWHLAAWDDHHYLAGVLKDGAE